MLKRLIHFVERFDVLGEELSDPQNISNQNVYRDLMREHKRVGKIVATGNLYKQALADREEAVELLGLDDDPEVIEMATTQRDEAIADAERLEKELQMQMAPRDPSDFRNCIIEIRAGTGGDEAAIFAADLFRLYQRWAERCNWKLEVMNSSEGSVAGFREVIFSLTGEEAFGWMKFEGGVHRVQRVPSTESQGRVHTSAASVAVLPEAEAVDIQIEAKDVRVDVYRSSGPGGQSVNTTDSAVRLTYEPTGTVVTCQDEKSQHKNKEKAMRVLRSRLYEVKLAEEKEKLDGVRRSQVSSGDRSAKIRTYNFPQNRITDHRIGLTLYKLEQVMDGDLTELLDALKLEDLNERLADSGSK
jgi:peptide chain release factor 1